MCRTQNERESQRNLVGTVFNQSLRTQKDIHKSTLIRYKETCCMSPTSLQGTAPNGLDICRIFLATDHNMEQYPYTISSAEIEKLQETGFWKCLRSCRNKGVHPKAFIRLRTWYSSQHPSRRPIILTRMEWFGQKHQMAQADSRVQGGQASLASHRKYHLNALTDIRTGCYLRGRMKGPCLHLEPPNRSNRTRLKRKVLRKWRQERDLKMGKRLQLSSMFRKRPTFSSPKRKRQSCW